MAIDPSKLDGADEGAGAWKGIGRRFDSLINTLSGIGGPRDRTNRQNVNVEEVGELSDGELEVLYRRNHYAARIVDLPCDEATRRGFNITVSEDENGGVEIEEEFRRLCVEQKFNLADKWARLYGGAAIIIGLDDGLDLSDPIDHEALKNGQVVGDSLDFLHVVDRYALSPMDIDADPLSPGFGQPANYTLHFRDMGAISAVNPDGEPKRLTSGSRIHASRLVRFYGSQLPPTLRSDQDWWGDSVLQRTFESLTNLGMMERAIGNIAQTFTQAIFKMQGLRQLVKQKDGADTLLERFAAMNLSQSVLSMMVIDAEMEEYEKRTTNVTGLEHLYDRIAQSFAASADTPMTLAFGLSPGGIGNSDDPGMRNWENKISARQKLIYVPGMEYIANILVNTRQGPKVSGNIMIDPVPLREPTEEEASATAKIWAEFAAILIDRGVVRPSEVRTSFFSGAGFSSDIVLEKGGPPESPAAPASAPTPADEPAIVDEPLESAMEPGANERNDGIARFTPGLNLAGKARPWRVSGALQRLRAWAGAETAPNEKYARAFLWVDPNTDDQWDAYRLPFADIVNGRLTVVPNALIAIAAELHNGSANVPATDLPLLRSLVSRHFTAMREAFNDPSYIAPWEK